MPEWRGEIVRRLGAAGLPPESEAEIVEELSQHLDDRYAELRSSGVADAEAQSRALAELELGEAGDLGAAVGAARAESPWRAASGDDVQSSRFHAGITRDARHAVRALRRTPGYTAVVTLTLALGIGAAAAAQAVIDPLLLRPLGFTEPGRLVTLDSGVMAGEFLLIREHVGSFGATALAHPGRAYGISGDGDAFRVVGAAVTPDFFATLGVHPAAGSVPATPDEPVAVLSHGLWRSRFSGDASVLGTTIRVEGRPVVVVAVMPPDFAYPLRTDVWLVAPLDPTDPGALWGMGGFVMVARLGPGATTDAAASEVRRLSAIMSAANPFWTPSADYREDVRIVTLHEALVGDVRHSLLLLGSAVALLLLIACANVANLVLARGLSRARELAVRTALGASGVQIVRQLVTETLVLAAAGGAAGIALAYAAVYVLRGMLPPELPRLVEVGVDVRVLVMSVAVTLLTGLILGVLPARRATRFDLHEALRDGGRALGGTSGRRLSGSLVVVQVALAVLLVTGAGLLVRSLSELQRTDTGIGRMEVVTARVDLPAAQYPRAADRRAFYEELRARGSALPGVQSLAVTGQLPFSGHLALNAMFVEGVTEDPNNLPVFMLRRATPELFDALGIRLLRGRLLEEADALPGALPVAVVDETAVRAMWPDDDPIGRRLGRPWLNEQLTVVGVVSAVLDGNLAGTPEQTVYAPFALEPPQAAFIVVHAAAGPGVVPALRGLLRDIDPAVPLSDVGTLSTLVSGTLAAQRLATTLLTAFGVLALLLAAVGIYGVLAYAVGQRTRELSLRLALGARAGDLLRMVLRDGMRLALTGAVIGVLAALALGRVVEGMLYGVQPHDPATFAVVALVVLAAAAAAVLGPALRASRVAPMDSLRA
jgi:putative ABC transport system permease protein